MNILWTLLVLVEAVVSVLLIGVILIQKSKGGGLGSAFGGGASESLLGSRAGNILTKITIVLAVLFLANTLVLAMIHPRLQSRSRMDLMGGAVAPATQTPMQQHAAPAAQPVATPGSAPTLPGGTMQGAPIAPVAPVAMEDMPPAGSADSQVVQEPVPAPAPVAEDVPVPADENK